MAIPMMMGADIGTQLSRNIRQGRQQEATIQGTQADTRMKRLQAEEFILNAQRRKAERSLGTATAESQLKRLPSQETIAIMKNTEAATQAAQLGRKLSLEADIGENAANLLARSNQDNWASTYESLGAEQAQKLGVTREYDSVAVDRAISGVVNNVAQRRAVSTKLAGAKPPEGKMAGFQAVSKDGKRTAAVDYSQATGYRVQVGKNPDGSAKFEALDPREWDLTKKSETTTKDALTPTTAMKTAFQKKLAKFADQAALLKGLAKDFTGEYLTTYGKILGFSGDTMDAWGGFGQLIDETQQAAWDMGGKESRSIVEWNANRSEYIQRINRFFNAYRHDITGAQASFAELKKLEDAILNQNMGPVEANKAIISFIADLEDKAMRTTQMLEDGFRPYTEWTTDKEGNPVASPEVLIPVGPNKPVREGGVDISKMRKRTINGVTFYE